MLTLPQLLWPLFLSRFPLLAVLLFLVQDPSSTHLLHNEAPSRVYRVNLSPPGKNSVAETFWFLNLFCFLPFVCAPLVAFALALWILGFGELFSVVLCPSDCVSVIGC